MRKLTLLSFLFLFRFLPVHAQSAPADSLKISLQQAEQLFQERNLPLLMQKANIEAARAGIIQARLFENPVIYLEQNIYNPINGREFDVTKTGESIISINQLFYMAGKRNKRVQVEELNHKLSEFEYFDLLRTLRYQLRTSYIQLHYQLETYQNLYRRTQAVKQLVTALNGQYEKGNVPLKEITRLRALHFALQNQLLGLHSEIQQQEADLRLLTKTPATTFLVPLADETALHQVGTGKVTFAQLLQEAQENRYDLKASETDVQRQEAQLKYQKSLAVPDLNLGATYDRAGSFVQNYTGLTLQMPLPLWNRNQGNIKIAKSQIEHSVLQLQQQQSQVENEVMQAYQHARTAEELYNGMESNFTSDFEKLIDGVTRSYILRNISLIEFLDYYETYTDSMAQMLELKSRRLSALEEINFAVGKPVITY